jgi:hypothetical protein
MIICDYVDGQFVEDKFNFQDDEESTEVSNNKSQPAEIAKNNKVVDSKEINEMDGRPCTIELLTR